MGDEVVVVIKECVVVVVVVNSKDTVVVLMVDTVDSGEQTRLPLVVMEDMVMEEDMEVVMVVMVLQLVQGVVEEAEGQLKGIASSRTSFAFVSVIKCYLRFFSEAL